MRKFNKMAFILIFMVHAAHLFTALFIKSFKVTRILEYHCITYLEHRVSEHIFVVTCNQNKISS